MTIMELVDEDEAIEVMKNFRTTLVRGQTDVAVTEFYAVKTVKGRDGKEIRDPELISITEFPA